MTAKIKLNNYLINGNFEYSQRSRLASSSVGQVYVLDRWRLEGSYDQSATFYTDKSFDVPVGSSSVYSCLLTNESEHTAQNSDGYVFEQFIEGTFLRPLKGKKLVLSFWVKSSFEGTYCVRFQNGISPVVSLIKEYTINDAYTWEKKTIRIEHDDSFSWRYDIGIGLRVGFVLAAGSNLYGTKDTWQLGDKVCTSNQMDLAVEYQSRFQLADVCLVEDNEGQTREPEFSLAGNNAFEELRLCQRYYEVLKDMGPGQVFATGLFNTPTVAHLGLNYLVAKRATPSISVVNVGSFRFNNGTNNFRGLNFIIVNAGIAFAGLSFSITTPATTNAPFNADCDNVGGAGSITIDAEL